MFCIKCGAALTSDDQFCKSCGTKVESVNSNNNELNNSNSEVSNNNDNNTTNSSIFDEPVISMTPIENSSESNIDSNINDNSSNDNNNNENSNSNSNNSLNSNMNNNINNNINNDISNNTNPSSVNSGNKNNILIFAIVGGAIVALILVFIVGVVVGNVSSKSKCDVSDNGTSTGGNGGNAGNADPVSTNSYKLSFGGFTFQIPDTMYFDIADNYLVIGNLEDTWAISLTVADGGMEPVQARITNLKSTYERKGLNAKNVESKKLSGREYITAEIASGGYNIMYAYTKATSSSVFAMALYNINNDFDYSILEDFTSVLDSAVKSDTTMNAKPKTDFDASKYFEK